MKRSLVPLLSLAAVLAAAAPARAQHDVPVWYIQYEVIVAAKHSAPTSSLRGSTTTTWDFERSFSASTSLDLRSEGSVFSPPQAMMDPEKMKNMSQAEMMKVSQDMLGAMQYTANWMPGPNDAVTDADAMQKYMKSNSVPVRFRYTKVTTGANLSDEMGNKYDYESTSTGTMSGAMVYPGDQFKFELNTQSKKYWILLPYGGQSMDTARPLKWETVEKTRAAGTTAWKEERTTQDAAGDWLPAFQLDKPANALMWPVIEGTYTSSDRITGQQSFKGSYTDGPATVPVTVTYRYTVSSKPLPAPAEGKK